MRSRCRLLACQLEIPAMTRAEERDRHLQATADKLRRELDRAPADLVVLPELSSIDYSRAAFDNLEDLAESVEGPSYEIFREIARDFGLVLVYGIPRIGETGYFISQVALGPDGRPIGYFDKLHIAQYGASMEKEYFERGRHLFVFEHCGIKIAPIICYDIRIPELTRCLVLQDGAQLILHCGAYARDRSFYSWHDFVVARALENQVYVMSLNRAGESYGRSVFCPPWVDEVDREQLFGDTEVFERFEIDTGRIDLARETYTFLSDRLGDYASLERLD